MFDDKKMIPVLQTLNGSRDGNCFEACVASILECAIAEIPPLVLNNPDDWFEKCSEFLHSRGYSAAYIHNTPPVRPRGFHIACGNYQDTVDGVIGHASVAKDGEIFWCPTFGTAPRRYTVKYWVAVTGFDEVLIIEK